MANMLMVHHAAKRNEPDRMNTMPMDNYDRTPMNTYGNQDRMPMQRPVHDEYDGGAESRYRGRDGRWKAGRRSEYEDERMDMPSNRRMGGDDDDEEGRKYKIEVLPHSNVIDWPYADPDKRSSRHIGFGASNHMNGSGGSMHSMGRSSYDEDDDMSFDRETAENWVRSMRNEDKAHPVGGKWSVDMLKPLAQKYGIPTDGKRFWEFYAMTNAMYSDYGEVARKFGITSPEFYACMAKAWMDDKDAEPDKTALYYEYIVKKNDHSPMAA